MSDFITGSGEPNDVSDQGDINLGGAGLAARGVCDHYRWYMDLFGAVCRDGNGWWICQLGLWGLAFSGKRD